MRLHVSLDEIGSAVSYSEAVDLVQALAITPGTYLHADLAGWAWPATWVDIATLAAATSTVNSNRDEKKHRDPVEFPWPWEGTEDDAEQVSDEERAALKATLSQHSAFRD